jgi:hypothetical protein
MAVNLDVLAQGVNKYIVTPLNAFGLGGFVFDIEGETTANLSAEITDHYLEDNSAIQDHIAIRPKKVTLKSYVGELVYREDDSTDTFFQKVVQKLTTLVAYRPSIARAAQQAIDVFKEGKISDFSLDNITLETVNKTTDYWAFVKNLGPNQSRQQRAYLYFKALMEGKFLVSVQTPFEFMNNMAIESIVAIQSEDSRFISDFSITLKEIRTVSILNVAADATRYVTREGTAEEINQGRGLFQNQSLNNLGNMPGLPTVVDSAADDAALEALGAPFINRTGDDLPVIPKDPLRLKIDDLVGEYGG